MRLTARLDPVNEEEGKIGGEGQSVCPAHGEAYAVSNRMAQKQDTVSREQIANSRWLGRKPKRLKMHKEVTGQWKVRMSEDWSPERGHEVVTEDTGSSST